MEKDEIINLWKDGFTVEQISKRFVFNSKMKNIKINLLNARKCVEPIIFNYQVNLFKN